MPTVPTYRTQVQPDRMPGARVSDAGASPQAFGAGVGATVANLGQTVESLGQQGLDLYAKIQHEDAVDAAQQKLVVFNDRLAKASQDGDGAWLNRKGVNASGVTSEAAKFMQSSVDELGKDLNPAARKMFSDHARSAMATHIGAVTRHEQQQKEFARNETAKALISQNADTYAATGDERALAAMRSTIEHNGRLQGLDQPAIDELTRDGESQAHVRRVNGFLAAGAPSEAQSYLANVQARMTQQDATTAMARIRPLADDEKAGAVARDMRAQNTILDAKPEDDRNYLKAYSDLQARTDISQGVKDKAWSLVNQGREVALRAATDRQQEAIGKALKIYQDTKVFPPDPWWEDQGLQVPEQIRSMELAASTAVAKQDQEAAKVAIDVEITNTGKVPSVQRMQELGADAATINKYTAKQAGAALSASEAAAREIAEARSQTKLLQDVENRVAQGFKDKGEEKRFVDSVRPLVEKLPGDMKVLGYAALGKISEKEKKGIQGVKARTYMAYQKLIDYEGQRGWGIMPWNAWDLDRKEMTDLKMSLYNYLESLANEPGMTLLEFRKRSDASDPTIKEFLTKATMRSMASFMYVPQSGAASRVFSTADFMSPAPTGGK